MSTRIAFRARYGPYLHDGPPIDHVDAVHQVETATVVGTVTPGTTQQETATIVGTIGVAGAGFAKITVTAAGMANSPKDISVAVANNDTAAQVAGKARSALGVDVDVIARFAVSGATDKIILTRLVAEADDGTLNIASDNDTCTGLTTEATSADTRAGVAPGTGDAVVTVTAAGMANSPKDVAVAVVAGDIDSVVAGKARAALTADVDVAAFFEVGGAGADIVLTALVAADHDDTINIAVDNDTCTGLTAAPTSASTVGGAAGMVGTGEEKIEKGGELIDTVSGAHYINAGTRHEPAYRSSAGIASLLDIPGNWSIWDARTLGLDDGEPVVSCPDSGTNGFPALGTPEDGVFTVDITGATSGQYEVNAGGGQTPAIAWNASEEPFRTAFESIFGADNVGVTVDGQVYTVTVRHLSTDAVSAVQDTLNVAPTVAVTQLGYGPLNRPIYIVSGLNGLPVMRFDSTAHPQFLELSGAALALTSGLTGITVLAVALATESGYLGFLVSKDTDIAATRVQLCMVGANGALAFTLDSDNLSSTADIKAPQNFIGVWDGKASMIDATIPTMAYAQTSSVPGPLPTDPALGSWIGKGQIGQDPYGDLALLAVCDRALNARERRVALEYLSESFGTL